MKYNNSLQVKDLLAVTEEANGKVMNGSTVTDIPVTVVSIHPKGENRTEMIISDCTSGIIGECNTPMKNLSFGEGSILRLSGKVMLREVDEKMIPLLIIRDIEVLSEDSLPMDDSVRLYGGVSPKVKDAFFERMNALWNKVGNKAYRDLLQYSFKGVLEEYKKLPATLVRHGHYGGGLLISTVAITEMALALADVYSKSNNTLYTCELDRDIVITAGLLLGYEQILYRYHKEPYEKTFLGIQLGPQGCLQKLLNGVISKYDLPLSEIDMSRLYNVQAEAFELKSGVRTTTKEGKILAAAARAYSICDVYDSEIKEERERAKESTKENGRSDPTANTDGYFFSEKLGTYLILPTPASAAETATAENTEVAEEGSKEGSL